MWFIYNTHLCRHLTPVMRGPVATLLLQWMMWMLEMINPLPGLLSRFWVVIGRWVVWKVEQGKGRQWV